MDKEHSTKITVTPAASKWFREEMHLKPDQGVHFFGRVYGNTNAHRGFSTGMSRHDHPADPLVDQVVDGIHYYIEKAEDWFFKGLDLTVDYDPQTDGPKYHYTANDGRKLDGVAHASKH